LLAAAAGTGLLGAVHLRVNGPVFLVGVGMALLFGLVSGAYPAWRMSRMPPLVALRGARR
jgi:putative ABC transport system permease protein